MVDPLIQIVKKLTMPNGYQSERYPNPLLTWFNRVIQAAALDELPMAVNDKTLPKFKSINTVCILFFLLLLLLLTNIIAFWLSYRRMEYAL